MAKKSSKKEGATTKRDGDEDTVAKLLDGYREHIRLASRTWTALAFLSVYVLAAVVGVFQSKFKLPFLEVELTASWFFLASEAILLALTLRWVEAIGRAIYTRKLVQPVLDRLDSAGKTSPSHKEVWDAQVFPGTGTVWSLPRALLGERRGKRVGLACCLCYGLLAALSVLVHVGLPACAVCILAVKAYYGMAVIAKVVATLGVVASCVLLATLCQQFGHIGRALKYLWQLATMSQ